MASDIKEAIRRLIYEYTSKGADEVMATQEAVAASTTKTDKASLSLEKAFGSLERRYVETVRSQQDYAKVQDKVNAAVAQNPALQERANVVLAQAKQHFDNVATGADKGSVAATVLVRTMMRSLGPIALVGVAVAGISSAMEFMEPIAVRVGADIYNRFSQAYPAVAQFADGIYKAAQQFIELEHAKAKAEAIDAAMRGVASSAELAALKLESVNQKLVNQRGMAEAAQAAERIADHVMRLREIYPGVTQEVAKQLELLDAQLKVAQARTEEERRIAEEKLRQVQLTEQGIKGEEQQLIIARERNIKEVKAETEARKDNVYYSQNQTAATNEAYKAQAKVVQAVDDTASSYNNMGQQIAAANQPLSSHIQQLLQAVHQANELEQTWARIPGIWTDITDAIDGAIVSLHGVPQIKLWTDPNTGQKVQFNPEGYTSTGSASDNLFTSPFHTYTGQVAQPSAQQTFFDEQRDKFFADAMKDMTGSLDDLTGSTDSLNATLQNILSPYYSQDPRTTKLGFRAGSVGNPDWMVAGASNANPLAALLGYGATAPGMANGGSFIVGGGYSANDNKIAAFPVASGEQVVVNRNRQDGGKVVNIDNRIIINGTVDDDAMSQLKVSRYQQAQRMRVSLSAA